MTKPPLGIVVYSGPSRLTGEPIVAIVTGFRRVKNRKTGPMLQLWILRQDMSPIEAKKCGADRAVCGDCPVRSICYVRVEQAPNQIWKRWRTGGYAPLESGHRIHFEGRKLRLGAYGEPTAIPIGIVRKLVRWCKGHTGYTHQHSRPGMRRWRELVMASCESSAAADRLNRAGWRTFRITKPGGRNRPREISCPAARKNGVTCAHCGLCNGSGGATANVSIELHGKALRWAGRHNVILD